jgi:hypothetical protein
LDVPPRWSGFHTIPDSVEQLLVSNLQGRGDWDFDFGADSRLKSVKTLANRKHVKSLLRISSFGLKGIRAELEFAPGQATKPPILSPDEFEEMIP